MCTAQQLQTSKFKESENSQKISYQQRKHVRNGTSNICTCKDSHIKQIHKKNISITTSKLTWDWN